MSIESSINKSRVRIKCGKPKSDIRKKNKISRRFDLILFIDEYGQCECNVDSISLYFLIFSAAQGHAAVSPYMKSLNEQQFAIHSWWLNGNLQTNETSYDWNSLCVHIACSHIFGAAQHYLALGHASPFLVFSADRSFLAIPSWMISSVKTWIALCIFPFRFSRLFSHILRALRDCVS